MIAEMDKIVVAGPRKLAGEIVLALQQSGVVHVDPLESGEIARYRLGEDQEDRLRRWDVVSISADHTLRLLGLEPDGAAEPFPGELQEAEAAVGPRERLAGERVEALERLRAEQDLISQYREVVDLLAEAVEELDESRWLAVLPFLVETRKDLDPLDEELRSTLGERFLLAAGPRAGGLAAVIVVRREDTDEAKGVLSHWGLAELPRPGPYAGLGLRALASRLKQRAGEIPAEMAEAEKDLAAMANEARAELNGLRNRGIDEAERLRTLRQAAAGRYGFALFGWVPSRLRREVDEVMAGFGGRAVHVVEPADTLHEAAQVPVLLENPRWMRPFESLVLFLNTPRYGSWDPTWIIATFFPFWFGMVVGDLGYAAVFWAATWFLASHVRQDRPLVLDYFKVQISPSALAQTVQILKPMVFWTVVWGLVYGECFGDFLQRLGVFAVAGQPGWIPVLIPRTDTTATANSLILVSIGFGIYQVLYGYYLKARWARRQAEWHPFWEASGYLGGVSALVLFAWAFMNHRYPAWIVIPTLAGLLVFLFGMARAKLPLMIAELPTQGGHILSYVRIYAVGLASAILANLATDMGIGFYHLWGLVGIVVGLAAGLILHAAILTLLTLGHILQPIRLIWVEFFTKFDFYGISGRQYRPLRTTGKLSSHGVAGD